MSELINGKIILNLEPRQQKVIITNKYLQSMFLVNKTIIEL